MAMLALALVAPALAACGDDGDAADTPTVAVTTTILGDVVSVLVASDASVEVVMPANVDPHDFAPSARDAVLLRDADAVVANGLGFEAGLADTLDAARDDGASVFEATDVVATRNDDPHVFADPVLMAEIVPALAEFLVARISGVDDGAVRVRARQYVTELEHLHEEIEALVDRVPASRRVLVTNHEVLGYFAARYGFEVLGAVIPAVDTLSEPSAADLAGLADQIRDRDVSAIFVETSSPQRVANTLAREVGRHIAVVELFTESLGPTGSAGDTYLGMMRTNAERITAALAS